MSWLKSGTARGPPVLPGHSPPGHGVEAGSRYLGRLPMGLDIWGGFPCALLGTPAHWGLLCPVVAGTQKRSCHCETVLIKTLSIFNAY